MSKIELVLYTWVSVTGIKQGILVSKDIYDKSNNDDDTPIKISAS